MPYVYATLVALHARDYHNMIVLSQLHMAYLRSVNHPIIPALMLDHYMANEEPGEASFAALSRAISSDPSKTEHEHLQRRYKMTGMTKDINSRYAENCGGPAGAQRQRHFDSAKMHKSDVDALTDHLRMVAGCIAHGFFPAYVDNSCGVTSTQVTKEAEIQYLKHAPIYIWEGVDFTLASRFEHIRQTYMDNVMHHAAVARRLQGSISDPDDSSSDE